VSEQPDFRELVGEELPPDARCVITGGPARVVAIFAKAY
jgi:hypothetical protein